MSNAVVTICIPYFEREELLTNTLQGFIDHGYPDQCIRVSICDDGSTKFPAKDIPLVQENMDWITVTTLPPKDRWLNACVPLNAAVMASDSPLVLLQSPETVHDTGFVPRMTGKVQDYKDVVLACVRCTGEPRLEWYSHPVHRPKRYWFCQMISKLLWLELGGLDEAYRNGWGWEDDDFVERQKMAGVNWIWCEKCVATHLRKEGQSLDLRGVSAKIDRNAPMFRKKYGKAHSW